MTDPKVLADALVEAGIVQQDTHSPGLGITRNLSTYNNGKTADEIITDWRVAGKVLELWGFDEIERHHVLIDGQDEPFLNIDITNPRAIIEAWYQAQEKDND